MKVSHYVCFLNVRELSSSVEVEVTSKRPTLDLAECFLSAHSYKTAKCVCDESIPFKPNLLVEIIDNVLDEMTVETLINFDDIEYREEEGWWCVLDLDDALREHIYQLPRWQLMMASDRLKKLSRCIKTKSSYEWMEC